MHILASFSNESKLFFLFELGNDKQTSAVDSLKAFENTLLQNNTNYFKNGINEIGKKSFKIGD